MRAYTIRRLLLTIPTTLLVTIIIIIFIVIRLIPGDVIDMMATEQRAYTEMDRANIMRALGLDQPLHVQYLRWIGDLVLRGDLGTSLWSSEKVSAEIMRRIPVTVELVMLATILTTLVAIPIGVYSAIRQDTLGDHCARVAATAGIALPDFWVGTMLVVFGSLWFMWSPALRVAPLLQDPLTNLGQFILPALILGVHGGGSDMRLTRTMMLEVLRSDYIRTAWAKGLGEGKVVRRHALKNSLIPIVTNMALHIPTRIGGSVILENIFGLPGVGRLLVEATHVRDYTMVSGVVLFQRQRRVVRPQPGLLDPRPSDRRPDLSAAVRRPVRVRDHPRRGDPARRPAHRQGRRHVLGAVGIARQPGTHQSRSQPVGVRQLGQFHDRDAQRYGAVQRPPRAAGAGCGDRHADHHRQRVRRQRRHAQPAVPGGLAGDLLHAARPVERRHPAGLLLRPGLGA